MSKLNTGLHPEIHKRLSTAAHSCGTVQKDSSTTYFLEYGLVTRSPYDLNRIRELDNIHTRFIGNLAPGLDTPTSPLQYS